MQTATFSAASPFNTTPVWSLPFDAARQAYAAFACVSMTPHEAVKVGLLPKPMIATSHFHRSVDSWEKISLGPIARSV